MLGEQWRSSIEIFRMLGLATLIEVTSSAGVDFCINRPWRASTQIDNGDYGSVDRGNSCWPPLGRNRRCGSINPHAAARPRPRRPGRQPGEPMVLYHAYSVRGPQSSQVRVGVLLASRGVREHRSQSRIETADCAIRSMGKAE